MKANYIVRFHGKHMESGFYQEKKIKIMKYKKMTVWSGGNENAKTAKTNAILEGICFIMLCILHVTAFICNPNDNKTMHATLGDHISFGMFFLNPIHGKNVLYCFFRLVNSFNVLCNKKFI